ncbi:NUDIX domain-containing protein [Pseudactinotalea sp. HY160]|nr:NUDIX domain-containing protein [Pseudactinotalea sp. HY160]
MSGAKKPVHAAGALLWRLAGGHLEVLLVHRPGYDDWSWPKGKLHKHETLPAAAVREVREETGVEAVLGRPLPTVRYVLGGGTPKVCWYWAATPAAGIDHSTAVPTTPEEVDEARWVEAVQALEMLTRRADRAPLMALLELHADGTLATWPVLLVRHGRARRRSAWQGGEDTRPLTATGQNQARSLVPILSAYGAARILTSPWARCALTVTPYSEAAGVPVAVLEELTEDGARHAPDRARAVLESVLSLRQPATVVCTHRPVLPVALAALAARAPDPVAARLPAADPYLRTGEVLIAHIGRPVRRNPAKPGRKKPAVVAAELYRGRS